MSLIYFQLDWSLSLESEQWSNLTEKLSRYLLHLYLHVKIMMFFSFFLVSAQPAFCPRSIPNEHAILGPDCINDHSKISCRVRCNTGYQLYSQRAQLYGVYIYCLNGTWATSRWERERGFGISNICLPEGRLRNYSITNRQRRCKLIS